MADVAGLLGPVYLKTIFLNRIDLNLFNAVINVKYFFELAIVLTGFH